jgi:hypothetical protein
MNVHAADLGRPVAAFGTDLRLRLIPEGAYFLPIPEGLLGRVEAVESHGNNPWTRYSIRFDDGSFASGLVFAEHFCFADGSPNQRSTRSRSAR